MADPDIYTVGGAVQAGDGIYIPRRADEDLFALCRSHTFAYVLAPRGSATGENGAIISSGS